MRTLYLDIETAPSSAYVWSLWNENIPLVRLLETSRVICFASKWDGSRKVEFFSEADNRRDMLDAAHDLLSNADVAVHYNGKNFDIRTLNKEFVLADMPPPAPFRNIDLLQVVRRQFRFASNKLEHIAHELGIGEKMKHEGFELWIKVMAGDVKALRRMAKYNKQDVILLEQLYYRIQPWIGSLHPNRAIYSGAERACPYCGTANLIRQGYRYTQQGKYQRFSCTFCKGWSTSGKSIDRVDIRPL